MALGFLHPGDCRYIYNSYFLLLAICSGGAVYCWLFYHDFPFVFCKNHFTGSYSNWTNSGLLLLLSDSQLCVMWFFHHMLASNTLVDTTKVISVLRRCVGLCQKNLIYFLAAIFWCSPMVHGWLLSSVCSLVESFEFECFVGLTISTFFKISLWVLIGGFSFGIVISRGTYAFRMFVQFVSSILIA